MNKNHNSNNTKETYKAPLCETHVIIPEGMICSSDPNKVKPYDGSDTNDYTTGGWF